MTGRLWQEAESQEEGDGCLSSCCLRKVVTGSLPGEPGVELSLKDPGKLMVELLAESSGKNSVREYQGACQGVCPGKWTTPEKSEDRRSAHTVSKSKGGAKYNPEE